MDKALKPPTNATALAEYKKKDVKAKRIILNGVNNHVVPHLSRKKIAREMWEALTKLYQSDNHNRKIVLREKLRSTIMSKTDTVSSYLTKISHICDELVAIGETVADADLLRTALNGFSKKLTSFFKGVVSRENLPNWERLWDDFVQEKTREEALRSRQLKVEEDEENIALAGGARKGKGATKTGGKGSSNDGKKKKDMSKVKCFACHKTGHYASQCPSRKKGKEKAYFRVSVEVTKFAAKFENEFSLASCLSSTGVRGA